MKIITPLQLYIEQIDQKNLVRYIALFLILFMMAIGFLMYNYYRSIGAIEEEIALYAIIQDDAQDLIQQYALVNKQKEHVEAILAQEKNFKINQYFYEQLSNLHIAYKEQESPIIEDSIEGYQEVRLDVTLEDINLKQLCELLERLEKKDRIYIKEVVIEKNSNPPTITVRIVIATLAKKEPNEIAE